MGRKTVPFNSAGIGKLPNNKPVKYEILTQSGGVNYVGVAKRGRVQQRISEHLEEIPGQKVRIQQFGSIAEAEMSEQREIKNEQPQYNEQGK